jgi:hypothetical protein
LWFGVVNKATTMSKLFIYCMYFFNYFQWFIVLVAVAVALPS